jgi:predicted Zn-ribbon and HTH transcriptional regulator
MASESAEDEPVRVSLPADLASWLEERAGELAVDRDALMVQLLASYRATAELDGEVEADGLEVALGDQEPIERRVGRVVDDRVADAVEAALAQRLDRTPDEVAADLGDRLDDLDADVAEKIEDVRERVIQVKREADASAPADHTHEELERIDGVVTRLAEVESAVDRLEADLADEAEDREAAVDAVEDDLEEVRERLQTVAWVVSDLREAVESPGTVEAVDRIKRAAAELDVDRAKCENCGQGVELALLTEPNCPHCEVTVTNVEGAGGFFSTPRLLVASQLESGE